MGKRILVQRRGRGTQQFRANTHKRRGPVRYPQLTPEDYKREIVEFEVVELLHDPGRGAPIINVKDVKGKKIPTTCSGRNTSRTKNLQRYHCSNTNRYN
jgi:large subunit ribosomal protein L2